MLHYRWPDPVLHRIVSGVQQMATVPQDAVANFESHSNGVAARFVQNCTLRACLETRSGRGVALGGTADRGGGGNFSGYGVETIFRSS
jgi:hypothetical protein